LLSVAVLTLAAVAPASAIQVYYQWVWNGNGWKLVKVYQPPTKPTAPAAPQQPKPVTPPASTDTAQYLAAEENYLLQRVNAERAKAGLAPLLIDYRLVQTARAKSKDMIDRGYFGHQSPTLGSPFDQMRQAGISYRTAGENIAGNSSAAGAMQSWLNSPGHRANILNPNFTRTGIGVVAGGPYGKMLTQQFIG